MKAIVLLAYYNPEPASSVYLFDNFIDRLIDSGLDVELIVPIPGRGVSKSIHKEYAKRLYEVEKDEHLCIHRFKIWMEGQKTIWRFVRYFFSCFKYYQIAKKIEGADIIFSESTPPILGATAALIKKKKHLPLVYNLQDIFPDSLVLTGISSENSILWKIGRRIEKFTYAYADRIITISEDFRNNILQKGVPTEKISVVYNWVDQNAVVSVPREENKLFDMYGLDRSKFYVTYNGNIGLSQNMDMLLEVAKNLEANEDIQFVLVGNGAYLDDVKRIINERNIHNVTLLPFQPYEDISHVFSLGDVSLVISKPGTGNGCVPSKTWSIMSASRPVLANFDENELKTIVESHNCGIFTKAGDKVAFADAILKLYNDRDLCREMGRNGRQFVMDNLTREVGTQKYVDVIKNVAAGAAK